MALSEAQIGALQTTMSDASVGAMLGRTAAWVARQRQVLADVAIAVALPCAVATVCEPTQFPIRVAVPVRQFSDWHHDGGIEILKPVTPRIVAWGRRFLASGWPVADIAGLFDVDPPALAIALGVALDGASSDD